METEKEYIPVTVDESHIITIGERLYTESIEFLREIVNNAYDADAALVEITATEDSIEIRDNGSGMDRTGLKQYFNIGSQQKLYSAKSPVFHRDRIGQFGIGKFASLSACQRFEVLTKKSDFVGRVVFDKKDWEQADKVLAAIPESLGTIYRRALIQKNSKSGIDWNLKMVETINTMTESDKRKHARELGLFYLLVQNDQSKAKEFGFASKS